MKLIPLLSLLFFTFSCTQEIKPAKKVINEKEFLDHIKLNDSIEFRIKEYDLKNEVKRDLCVFKNGEVIKEHPIYFVRKKELLDEGYNSTTKKIYKSKRYDEFEIQEFTTHYFDYTIESVDTITKKLKVTAKGEIVVEKL